ncbi:MAG: FGGY-family carbohydrate kinase [Spirochaetia bacterium]
MAEYAIAVFDVGKTNKKIVIYDEKLEILASVYESFPVQDKYDMEMEDIEKVDNWFLLQLKNFAQKFPIKAISVTTHGATFACVDKDGDFSVPVVSYTTEPESSFHDAFYKEIGKSPNELQSVTATAEFKALINMAKGIYYIKNKFPKEFARTKYIFPFPQYFSYLLTGKAGADYTYLGCHSYLWDFKKFKYSKVAKKLKIRKYLPKRIEKSWKVLGTVSSRVAEVTGLSKNTIVTMGIHDSNASLLPYLIKKGDEKFVLNSTGTWCVAMRPSEDVTFSPDEIGKVVFYNLSAFGTPVKTSILLGGLEFETYTDLLKKLNFEEQYPTFDINLYKYIIAEKKLFILPGVVKGTGQFPDSDPRVIENGDVIPLEAVQSGENIPEFFIDYPTAYAVLNVSLAIQTKIALERVGLEKGDPIYVEGGFRNNPDYNSLLTALFPESPVYLTNIAEATSYGAAILSKAALEGKSPRDYADDFTIETKNVEPVKIEGFDKYIDSFLSQL